jgi:hypothetical protein
MDLKGMGCVWTWLRIMSNNKLQVVLPYSHLIIFVLPLCDCVEPEAQILHMIQQ